MNDEVEDAFEHYEDELAFTQGAVNGLFAFLSNRKYDPAPLTDDDHEEAEKYIDWICEELVALAKARKKFYQAVRDANDEYDFVADALDELKEQSQTTESRNQHVGERNGRHD